MVAELRQPLRLSAKSKIVDLPSTDDGATIRYGGVTFKVDRAEGLLLLWAVD